MGPSQPRRPGPLLIVSTLPGNGSKSAVTNGSSGTYSLPRGRHRIPAELVAQNQRQRLIAGVGQALGEHGYGRLTVARVIDAAGVSRTTFYQHFDNKQSAVLAAHEDAFERLLCLVLRACDAQQEWPLKLKASIGATLRFAAEEPDRARLLTLGALSADRTIGRRLIASRDHFAVLLAAGRRHSTLGLPPTEITERALIGGIASLIAARLTDGDPAALPDLEPQLVELVLTQYLGAREAARIARFDLLAANGSNLVRRQ